jgi:CRISPR type I-E-associated protein CasA/Cse1
VNYNLLDEKWIPVLYSSGKFDHVGIKEALAQANKIRCIAASNPMDRVAIIRFLLAILYWCKGNPPEGNSMRPVDSLPADWFSKLEKNRNCFNLLGETARFYQDPNAKRSRTITDLLQEIPTGNNFWHFRHSTDEKDGLCLSCCVLGLLRLPLFSVSGLPDLKSGINGVPPIYVVPVGLTLTETLAANWIRVASVGVPSWTQPTLRPSEDSDVPLLTGLTVLSRRVWLHEIDGPIDTCIGCGLKTQLVRTCEFQTAGRLENARWNDPHVLYFSTPTRKSYKAADLTEAGKFRMDRPWPDLLARIAKQNGKKIASFLIVGFATDNAKNVDVWERVVTMPLGEDRTPFVEQWRKENKRLESRVSRSKSLSTAMIVSVRPHVEYAVSTRAAELFTADDAAWQKVAKEYNPMMTVIAKSLSPGFMTDAVQRRRHIASLIPDMQIKKGEEA